MNKEERFLKIQNDLNFGIETKDGTFYVPKDDVITIVSDLLDEVFQPQLTIPKSVADYSEKLEQSANPQNKNWKKFLPTEQEEQEHWAWLRKDNNKHIYQAYLAGKTLGVDLVKVVEG